MRPGGTIRLALNGTDSAILLLKGRGDGTNLCKGTGCKDDSLGTAFGDSGGAIGDVEAVTRASCLIKDGVFIFTNR